MNLRKQTAVEILEKKAKLLPPDRRHETVEQLLGPRYVWALHTEPAKRMLDYIRTLEARVNELQGVKPCECPPT